MANSQNGMEKRRNEDKNTWNDMLAMLAMANKTDPTTLLGFGLGRLLRNYYQRGEEKRARLKGEGAVTNNNENMPSSEYESALARYSDELQNLHKDEAATRGVAETMAMIGGPSRRMDEPSAGEAATESAPSFEGKYSDVLQPGLYGERFVLKTPSHWSEDFVYDDLNGIMRNGDSSKRFDPLRGIWQFKNFAGK